MKATIREFDDDGNILNEEDVVCSISYNEENINERFLWINIPSKENNKYAKVYVDEIINNLLERLGLRTV